jgi:hypothetical protein
MAAVALFAGGLAAYVVAGPPGTVIVAVVFAVVALAVASRLLAPAPAPPRPREGDDERRPSTSFINYWRWRTAVVDATRSIAAYHAGLGPQLEHLLAARLAENHGISLYSDPDKARRALCASNKDADLWPWVDPSRPSPGPDEAPGIPPRTLARLVHRLEQL